jgi:hypothetical protein
MIVSALVMAGGAVVMLLYAEGRHSDENVRVFLVEVAEHYMKVQSACFQLIHMPGCRRVAALYHCYVLPSHLRWVAALVHVCVHFSAVNCAP